MGTLGLHHRSDFGHQDDGFEPLGCGTVEQGPLRPGPCQSQGRVPDGSQARMSAAAEWLLLVSCSYLVSKVDGSCVVSFA